MKKAHIHYATKFSWVQACWIAIAVILFSGGVYSIMCHDELLATEAQPLGCAMLLAGIINLVVCDIKHHEIHGVRWLIADGIVAILLSLFPLFNKMTYPLMIPFFFGMWELFSGVLKVMDSTELKTDKNESWLAFMLIGWIELMSGAASLIKPFDDMVGFNKVIAIIFFVQSMGFLLKAAMYKYLIK